MRNGTVARCAGLIGDTMRRHFSPDLIRRLAEIIGQGLQDRLPLLRTNRRAFIKFVRSVKGKGPTTMLAVVRFDAANTNKPGQPQLSDRPQGDGAPAVFDGVEKLK